MSGHEYLQTPCRWVTSVSPQPRMSECYSLDYLVRLASRGELLFDLVTMGKYSHLETRQNLHSA